MNLAYAAWPTATNTAYRPPKSPGDGANLLGRRASQALAAPPAPPSSAGGLNRLRQLAARHRDLLGGRQILEGEGIGFDFIFPHNECEAGTQLARRLKRL